MNETTQLKPQMAIVKSEKGGELVVMPIQKYRELSNEISNAKSNRMGWIILSSCAGASLLLGAIGWVMAQSRSSTAAAYPAPSPVVIEKPVIVDRNCLLWCNK